MSRRTGWKTGQVVVLVAAAIAVGGCSRADRGRSASASVASEIKAGEAAPAPGSLREVHVALEVELRSADGAHATLAKLGDAARGAGGFVQLASFGKDDGRSHVVLRVPVGALAGMRAACAEAGAIVRDEETTTDVTDAIADVDARLRAGRTEELRLLALVDQRTGSVADVLAAERALADVRDRIERLDAESRASHGRVELATADVWLAHPTAAPSEGSIATRLAVAAKDGAQAAGDMSLATATTTLRLMPSLAILGLLASAVVQLLRRWRARRVVASGV